MSEFFIKRGDTVKGPISLGKIKALADAGKLLETDLVGRSESGVFTKVTHYIKVAQDSRLISRDAGRSSPEPDVNTNIQTTKHATGSPKMVPPDSGATNQLKEASDESQTPVDQTSPKVSINTRVVPSAQASTQAKPPAVPSSPSTSKKNKLIVVGGISGGVLLLLIVVIVVIAMKPGTEVAMNDSDLASMGNSSNSTNDLPKTSGNGGKSETESNKSVKADDASKPEDFSYVVPDKIEKFPPRMIGKDIAQYFVELVKLKPSKKTDFEKTEDYNNRIKSEWNDLTIFGQPTQNRFLIVVKNDGKYDPDSEALVVSSGLYHQITDRGIGIFEYLRPNGIKFPEAPQIGSSGGFEVVLNLAPEEARNVVDQIHVAYVVKFDANPLELTGTDFAEGRVKLAIRHWAIKFEKCTDILVYRQDTGEILLDVVVDLRTKQEVEEKQQREWEEIHLPKIVEIWPELPKRSGAYSSLIEFKSLRFDDYYLKVTSLTDSQADLLGHLTLLRAQELTELSDRQAESLSKIRQLYLPKLTSVTENQAKSLAKVHYLEVPLNCQKQIDKYKSK